MALHCLITLSAIIVSKLVFSLSSPLFCFQAHLPTFSLSPSPLSWATGPIQLRNRAEAGQSRDSPERPISAVNSIVKPSTGKGSILV